MKGAPELTQSSSLTRSSPPLRQASSSDSRIDSQALAIKALEVAIGQKAHDVRVLDLTGVSDIADFFVLASGTSDRHVKGIADKIRSTLREYGESPSGTNGYESSEWIVLDYGNVVVHIFFEPTRQYYLFDELWSPAKEVELEPPLSTEARKLRTGIIS